MNYIVTILLFVISALLAVVTYFLKQHFDKVDKISGDVSSIKETLTSFKIEIFKHEKRLELVEKEWKHEVFGKVK